MYEKGREMQNNQKKEPIQGHDVCPYCGSDKRIVGDYITELKEAGVISEESFPDACGALEVPLLEIKKLGILQAPNTVRKYPAVKILFDVCGNDDCKKIYVKRVDFIEKGVMQQQMPAK